MQTILMLMLVFTPALCVAERSPAEEQMDYSSRNSEQNLTITESVNRGRYIVLSDNSTYEIYPPDRTISAGWLVPAEVRIKERHGSRYPYLIINKWTGAKVRAREVDPTLAEQPSVNPKKKSRNPHQRPPQTGPQDNSDHGSNGAES